MNEEIIHTYFAERFDRLEQNQSRLESKVDVVSEKVYDIHGRTSAIEVKSSVFGLAGGFFAGLLLWLKSHIG